MDVLEQGTGAQVIGGWRTTLAVAVCMAVLAMAGGTRAAARTGMSDAQLQSIGTRIWQNECGGSVDGLTSWNGGEDFASLGIGHFIWYPEGRRGPYEESFPMLVAWFGQRGVAMPKWLVEARHCPWPNRSAFAKDHDSPRQRELRALLSATVHEQVRFIIARLQAAAPRMQAAAGPMARRVAANMQLLSQTPAGTFAMIDYVNFKGEGLNPTEQYKGEGWGLLQVLATMEARNASGAPAAFAAAARQVLARRVQNSPPEKKENRWLDGWLNRCSAYAK